MIMECMYKTNSIVKESIVTRLLCHTFLSTAIRLAFFHGL
jgi:hypothetical protein